MDFHQIASNFKAPISGRYITNGHIVPLLPSNAVIAGWSVQDRDIYAVEIGHGNTKILIWSQMHGNESTTTKAIMDFLQFLQSDNDDARYFLKSFKLLIVPILNPDGAFAYTRENANGIDLNRDFVNRTQPETRLLLRLFNEFQPEFCLNMHDQRTIYGAGDSGKPATISFLSPSYNENRDWNETRTRAASVIAAMNETLQALIPGQVGRYDDSFNLNCVGDTFQSFGISTILFEAGHFPNDYQREETRNLVFIAMLSGLHAISSEGQNETSITEYLKIPQNRVNFYDFVYKNIKLNYEDTEIITNFAAQFLEQPEHGKVVFEAMLVEAVSDDIHGHVEYDGRGEVFSSAFGPKPVDGMPADFFIGKRQFQNGSEVEVLNA